ncbi:putative RNA-directed DNA polymerase from transposon X-element [Portunus trituberculatus]|uniref:Putative RNA-directed DNA polymerase from transposon X-element n=1 Tax=Portunus trituberculatus TaxID=210409 RepID=A0A5B7FHN1_PORTR|nr:putative RNA-directed DNA polymerase from transposon X-element [Portunus trituberculatus]
MSARSHAHHLIHYATNWLTGKFSFCWKSFILIAKPGKDPILPLAYRLIALLSCIGMLMEQLVTTWLSWWMEDNHLLREPQRGFRPCHCTLDVLVQMEYHTCDTYCQQ